MHCEKALDLISARLDGELPSDDAARLEAHLVDCAPCRSALEAFQAQDGDLRAAYTACGASGDRVARRVAAQVRATPIPKGDRMPRFPLRAPARRVFGWLATAAAAIAVVY